MMKDREEYAHLSTPKALRMMYSSAVFGCVFNGCDMKVMCVASP